MVSAAHTHSRTTSTNQSSDQTKRKVCELSDKYKIFTNQDSLNKDTRGPINDGRVVLSNIEAFEIPYHNPNQFNRLIKFEATDINTGNTRIGIKLTTDGTDRAVVFYLPVGCPVNESDSICQSIVKGIGDDNNAFQNRCIKENGALQKIFSKTDSQLLAIKNCGSFELELSGKNTVGEVLFSENATESNAQVYQAGTSFLNKDALAKIGPKVSIKYKQGDDGGRCKLVFDAMNLENSEISGGKDTELYINESAWTGGNINGLGVLNVGNTRLRGVTISGLKKPAMADSLDEDPNNDVERFREQFVTCILGGSVFNAPESDPDSHILGLLDKKVLQEVEGNEFDEDLRQEPNNPLGEDEVKHKGEKRYSVIRYIGQGAGAEPEKKGANSGVPGEEEDKSAGRPQEESKRPKPTGNESAPKLSFWQRIRQWWKTASGFNDEIVVNTDTVEPDGDVGPKIKNLSTEHVKKIRSYVLDKLPEYIKGPVNTSTVQEFLREYISNGNNQALTKNLIGCAFLFNARAKMFSKREEFENQLKTDSEEVLREKSKIIAGAIIRFYEQNNIGEAKFLYKNVEYTYRSERKKYYSELSNAIYDVFATKQRELNERK